MDYLRWHYNGVFDKDIKKAISFGDLSGAKYLLKKFNKTYPLDIYDKESHGDNLKIAIVLSE